MFLCVGLALPFLLQPVLYPFSAEKCLPLCCRYSVKANVWIAIFSFIGNYWYTHYFYSVLGVSELNHFNPPISVLCTFVMRKMTLETHPSFNTEYFLPFTCNRPSTPCLHTASTMFP